MGKSSSSETLGNKVSLCNYYRVAFWYFRILKNERGTARPDWDPYLFLPPPSVKRISDENVKRIWQRRSIVGRSSITWSTSAWCQRPYYLFKPIKQRSSILTLFVVLDSGTHMDYSEISVCDAWCESSYYVGIGILCKWLLFGSACFLFHSPCSFPLRAPHLVLI